MSNIKSADVVVAVSTSTPPAPTTPPESPRRAPLRLPGPTPDGTSTRAESVRVTDVPAHGRGRAYLVERGLEQDGNSALKALIADYLDQAERHQTIPVLVDADRYLAHVQ